MRFFLLFFFLTMSTLTFAQTTMTWSQLPPVPDSVGFAGAYAGVSNGALLLAGGANFPDNVGPWGSTPKTWYDDVFLLEKREGSWKKIGKLPHPMGYGVALTTPDGVLCIGGADATRHYADVFVLSYRNGRLTTKPLPALPVPLANACGALLGSAVYVAGGIESPTDTTAEKVFLRLDLAKPNAAWQRLAGWPGPGRMLTVAGSLAGNFFLFSGTELARDPITDGIRRTALRDAYAYEPARNRWKRLADLPHATVAAPSPAFANGRNQLLVLGGDDGANADKNLSLKERHPGFRKEILAYNPLTNTWTTEDEVFTDKKPDAATNPSGSLWPPVTTPLVVWNGQIVLPNGEVRPGVRTNRVLTAKPIRQ